MRLKPYIPIYFTAYPCDSMYSETHHNCNVILLHTLIAGVK